MRSHPLSDAARRPAFNLIAMLTLLLSASAQGQSTPSPLHADGRWLKDQAGQTVSLRGLQKVEMADDPDGIWHGATLWSDDNVRAELAVMKSWGANTIRCIQAIENWKYDLRTPYAGLSGREAVKRLLTLAGQKGLYVIFTGYRVTNYHHGGEQDPLPYPPYQTSRGASSVIASKQDFIDWWADVARALQGYPNVLFEVWNEPHGSQTAMREYFGVLQQVIAAIRGTGARQLILAQWDYATWANLDAPPPAEASTLEWITQARLSDPLNNLVYVTHLYREYGHTGLYTNPASIAKWGTNHAYDYREILKAFQIVKLDWVQTTLNRPLFVTETGCHTGQTGKEADYEIAGWENTLKILDEWGIHYVAHWFRDIGIFRLHSGAPDYVPTTSGITLQRHLRNINRRP